MLSNFRSLEILFLPPILRLVIKHLTRAKESCQNLLSHYFSYDFIIICNPETGLFNVPIIFFLFSILSSFFFFKYCMVTDQEGHWKESSNTSEQLIS